jgi:predicted choloylglycine hydrolase
MRLCFSALDDRDGQTWSNLFARLWPAYRTWYMREGEAARPTYVECRAALRSHMPELVSTWERLVDLAGGGDLAAGFLTLYSPPAYLTGCSQAIWPGEEPLLVRNYDYSPAAFDGVALRTCWNGRDVLGTSDCLVGLVDGVNEAGLAVSLTFGGRRIVGTGFGLPIVLRYILETCTTTAEAARILLRVPVHMAYNVTVIDKRRNHVTAYLGPDRKAEITNATVVTNHQNRVEWAQHARATSTVERERFLLSRLTLHEEPDSVFVGAFLKPPLYSLAFDQGFGTLYTAAIRPCRQSIDYRWPGSNLMLSIPSFNEEFRTIEIPTAA